MKKEKWSDYASYLVLSDKSGNKLGCTFVSYLNFKKVKEILNWSDDQYVECLNIQLNNLSRENSLS